MLNNRPGPLLGMVHWTDPDMLEVGNPGLRVGEARTQMSMWAVWAAPLIAGNDPRDMRPGDPVSQILLNHELIDIDQDALGRPGCLLYTAGGVQTWVRPLAAAGTV